MQGKREEGNAGKEGGQRKREVRESGKTGREGK